MSYTKGPWKVNGPRKTEISCGDYVVAKALGQTATCELEAESNARLIAAAPNGLKCAENTYLAILGIDHNEWRVLNQHIYCALRDYIAEATGHSAEEVQNDFESRAAIAKATGQA